MSGPAYLFELTIQAGKLDEFKAKAEGYTEAVKKDEPGTVEYQWWIAEDGSRCLLKETFTSSEALLQHLANVGPSLPDLLAIAPITPPPTAAFKVIRPALALTTVCLLFFFNGLTVWSLTAIHIP